MRILLLFISSFLYFATASAAFVAKRFTYGAFLVILAGLSGEALALPEGNTLLLGVNEGTSGSANFFERQEKYKGLAEYLERTLKKTVRLESAQNLSSLTANLKNSRYDLLFVRPSHISAKAMRDQNYTLVASAKGDAHTYFIVSKNSPVKQPSDIRGKRIAMPDPLAYPTRSGLAMLRDIGIVPEKENIRYFSSQEAVGYAVEKNLIDVGVIVSYSKVAKDWKTKGSPIVLESKNLPFWSIIASPKIGQNEIAKIRTALISLQDNEAGKKIMEDIGVKSFVAGNQGAYLELLAWVKE